MKFYMKSARLIHYIYNIILILIGLAGIIVGSIAVSKTETLFSLTRMTNGAAVFLILVGCVLLVVGVFGYCGSWKTKFCILISYCVILSILLIVTIVVMKVAFVVKDLITSEEISKHLKKSIEVYDDDTIKTWDALQVENKCCGSLNFSDWAQNVKFKETQSVPDSCCLTANQGCGYRQIKTPENIFLKGCAMSLVDFVRNVFQMIGIIAIIIAVFLFLGIFLSAFLAHKFRNTYTIVDIKDHSGPLLTEEKNDLHQITENKKELHQITREKK